MKNLITFAAVLITFLFINLGCAKFTSSFTDEYKLAGCQIKGKKEPVRIGDYLDRADRHRMIGEHGCQFYACQQAVNLDPKVAEAYSCRGRAIYDFKKDYAQAIADFNTAIELRPFFEFFRQRGKIHELENQLDPALADYEKYFEHSIHPAEKGAAKALMAEIHLQKNQFDLALAAINQAIDLMPDAMTNYATRARIYTKQGKTELAATDMRKIIELKLEEGNTPSDTAKSGKPIDVGILNDKAVKLVQPSYPSMAKEAKVQGTVQVHVVIDEQGKVTDSMAFSGPTALHRPAQNAAAASKFPPTMVDGKPVKVKGIVVYKFQLGDES